MVMLKDSFYGCGLVSKTLNVTIFLLVALMYLSIFFDQFSINALWYNNYINFSFILFLTLIIKGIWFCFNQRPMSIAMTKVGAIILRINLLLIYLSLWAIIIMGFWAYLFDVYFQYSISVSNKLSYKVFGITLIPFSVIQLICYLLETYVHLDTIYLKAMFTKWWVILFVGVLPILCLIYVAQVILNRILYKKSPPERLC